MFRLAKPFFLMTETPLHAGSGQDLGIVDLPIQRERHTDFPKIEGSGLKGCIREAFEQKFTDNNDKKKIHLAFGYDDSEKNKDIKDFFEERKEFAGALGFTDVRILLFPVKSMKGVFAWISCPSVLSEFKEELAICKNSGGLQDNFFDSNQIPPKNTVADAKHLCINNAVILEEYSFAVREDETTKNFASWLAKLLKTDDLQNKLVILSDEDFRDFVNLSTEVITRTKIDNQTGTVQNGALFTEEYLPSETVMYSLVLTTPIFNKTKGIFEVKEGEMEEKLVMEFFEKGIPDVIQIGGNATIGKGITRIELWGEKNE